METESSFRNVVCLKYKFLKIGASCVNWAQLSMFHLKTGTESIFRNVACLKYKFLKIGAGCVNLTKLSIFHLKTETESSPRNFVRLNKSPDPGSIPGTTRFSEKQWVWNGVHSASSVQLKSYLEEKVAAPV
jgi:hypothetical protein